MVKEGGGEVGKIITAESSKKEKGAIVDKARDEGGEMASLTHLADLKGGGGINNRQFGVAGGGFTGFELINNEGKRKA